MREVAGVVGDLRRQHDLPVVDDCLGVIALDVVAHPLHQLGVRVSQVHGAARDRRWLPRVRWATEPPAVAHLPTRAPRLIGPVAARLGRQLVLQPPGSVAQPFAAPTRDWGRVSPAVGLEVTPRLARPALAPLDPINDPVSIKLATLTTGLNVRVAVTS